MTQTVANFTTNDPSGVDNLTVDMEAKIEDYSAELISKDDNDAEERYESTPELHATPWRATLESTDYCREIGWYATSEEAAAAAVVAARQEDLVGEVETCGYFA